MIRGLPGLGGSQPVHTFLAPGRQLQGDEQKLGRGYAANRDPRNTKA